MNILEKAYLVKGQYEGQKEELVRLRHHLVTLKMNMGYGRWHVGNDFLEALEEYIQERRKKLDEQYLNQMQKITD